MFQSRGDRDVCTDWASPGQKTVMENIHSRDDLPPGQLEKGYKTIATRKTLTLSV